MNKKIHKMKKIILHIHLDGSLRPTTVQEWLLEDGLKLELKQIQSKLMINENCENLNEYLKKFDLPMQVLQSEQRLERATYEIYEDLAKQNVIYAEVRYAPCKHVTVQLSYEKVVEATIRGMRKAKKEFNIDGNLILCCMRGSDNQTDNLETISVAKQYLGKGVCAVDLAGAEDLFKTENFENIFTIAKQKDIPFTIHAGEASGPKSIKKAIEFGAKRIGHGIRCIEDSVLIQKLKNKNITLEICPTSNIQTQAIKGKHPLEELYNRKILTTINTDNNTVSNTNLEKEYIWVLENTNLKYSDLEQMNVNAAKAIFDTQAKKEKLIKEMKMYN